jgi:uncharacterized MAPEG superfamily protein
MTNDQKRVAAGAASGVFAMLVGLVALSGILAGLAADAGAGERMAYAVKWIALGALPLALAIASVGNARFNSEAIDPTAGKENSTMVINGRMVDNTVQQYLLFAAASLAVAASARGDQLGIIAVAAIIFIIARLVFWIGYRIRPVYRAAGFASTFYLNLVLFGDALWLAWRP